MLKKAFFILQFTKNAKIAIFRNEIHFFRIFFFRVLGEELHRLRTLSVCYCGLEDLDGISYAPNIVNLCAAYNQISDVYPITELRKIHTLDLENNEFEDYGSISFLFICPKLENLVLKGKTM